MQASCEVFLKSDGSCDKDEMAIKDFANSEDLMIDAPLVFLGRPVVRRDMTTTDRFRYTRRFEV